MKTYIVVVKSDGTIEWYKEGTDLLHREDGPAIERADGAKWWYINGKLHREGGPAAEWNDGEKEWWINGKRHRENGPAVEMPNGTKEWYINGKYLTGREFNNRANDCDGRVVEIDGRKYKLNLTKD